MLIQQRDDNKNGAFYIEENEVVLAEITYVWSGEQRFIIDHTEVSEQLAGKGVGKQLLDAAIAFARSNGHKIIPLCPFAKKVMERTGDYHDILHKH